MAISSTIPARTFQPLNAARASVKYQPSESLKLVNSAESTRSHLSNLEKLLHKEADPHSDKVVVEKVPIQRRNHKNFLEHLSLSAIWPEMMAAEEVSPRNLNRLQRLLSMTAEYSPRNNLAGRWREYHGGDDWAGLLDPLDENLRREIVRYGEFVQAAYHSFGSESAASTAESPPHLPDESYKVTESLYATSSVELPKWVDTQRSSWIGYVAVCDDEKEIQRMGRRDIMIALRGTCTCLEWAENLRAQLAPISDEPDPTHEQPKVGCGFLNLYKTRGAHVPSLSESVVAEVKRLMELYKGETLSITVTGHSLGAALALLVADELSSSVPDAPPVAVFSFGSPRVGNQEFANRINRKNIKVLRIVNSEDVVTRVPANPVKEGLNQKLRKTGVRKIIDAIDKNMSWEYVHVGTELRVETRMSPYLKPNADMACCHDLEAYLHLVDGFVASNGPFRENAKRSLVKLVDEQGSNVKRLYKSKAKSLSSLNIRRNGVHMVPANCLPSPS